MRIFTPLPAGRKPAGFVGRLVAVLLFLAAPAALGQSSTFQVTGTTPAAHAPGASRTAAFELQLSQPIDPTTWDGITMFASSKHAINTKGTGSSGRVLIIPANPLRAGEQVTLTVPASVRSTGPGPGGMPIVKRVVEFTAAASGSPNSRLVARFQPEQRLAHLGDATLADVDGDGFLDALASDPPAGRVEVMLNSRGPGICLLLPAVQKRVAVPVGTTLVRCADVDNDGDLDLLCSSPGGGSSGAGKVNLCFNDGTGTFGPAVVVSSGWNSPVAMCVGDLDADGDLDLAVADAAANTLVVCTNDGTGSFSTPAASRIACAGTPVDVVCTDTDNDGDLDLVASCRGTGQIAILIQQIAGWTAGLRMTLPPGSNPTGVCPGDVNGDGLVDFAVACAGGTSSGGTAVPPSVQVQTQTSTGPYTGRVVVILSMRTLPTLTVSLADLDGDGDLDLLCPHAGGTGVVVCRNNGPSAPGTFTDGTSAAARAASDGPIYAWGHNNIARVVPGDLDNDGDMDAVAVCTGSGDVASMINQIPVRVLDVSPRPHALVAGGLSTIGITYSAPVDPGSFSLSSNYLQKKLSKWSSGRSSSGGTVTGSSTDPRTVAEAIDPAFMAKGNFYDHTLTNMGNTSDKRFLPSVHWTFDTRPDPSDGTLVAQPGTPFTLPTGAVICPADVDGDGLNDLITVTGDAGIYKLEALKRIGSTGSYAAAIVTNDPSPPTGYTPAFLRCADVNNDGFPDAVVLSTNGTNSYCSIYTGSASGAFTKLEETPVLGTVAGGEVCDDGNGDTEMLMVMPGDHAINTKGTGTGGRTLPLSCTPAVVTFDPGTLNGEGRLIVGGTCGGMPHVKCIPVDAAGGLYEAEADDAALPAAPGLNIVAADLDGDGRPEVVVAMPSAHAINTKGTGSSGRSTSTGAGSSPTRVCVADLDGDGDRDVLAVCPGNNTLWVGLNNGSGVFSSSYTVAVPAGPVEAWLGDADADGLADVLVRCADNAVRLYEVSPPAANDLFVTTTLTVPVGAYHNITILPGGDATFVAGSTCSAKCDVGYDGKLRGPLTFVGAGGSTGGTAGDLHVAPGATLYIDNPAGISATGSSGQLIGFNLQGRDNDQIFSRSASYVYTGTTPQLSGSGLPPQVYELTVASTGSLTLTQPTTVTGRLVVKPSCVLRPTTPATQLRLRSSADSTALVVNEGTGVVQGTVAVEVWASSHTTPNAYGYHHLSPPISNGIVGNLGTRGHAPTGSVDFNVSPTPALVRPFPTVMYYDQSRQLTAVNNLNTFDKGWASPAALTDALPVGRGISSNMPGDNRMTFTGTLNNGDISIPLSRNPAPTTGPDEGGWALVGNPYPSPIDWSLLPATDRPGLDAAVYVFKSSGQYSGRFLSYVNGLGDLGPLLAMGQGFWVRVSAGQTTGTLTVKNPVRTTSKPLREIQFAYRSGTAARPTLRLSLAPEANAGLADNLYLYLQAGATTGRDKEFDASKMPNSTGLNLSATASTGEALAIQGLPTLGNQATVVPLALGLPAAGRYTLAVGELANFAPGSRLVLRDQLLGTTTVLTPATSYAFASTATTVAGRFFLELAPAGGALASTAQLLDAGVCVYPNPARATATVQVPAVPGAGHAALSLTDALGRVMRTLNVSLPVAGRQTTLDLTGLAPGLYAVRVRIGSAVVVRRLAVE